MAKGKEKLAPAPKSAKPKPKNHAEKKAANEAAAAERLRRQQDIAATAKIARAAGYFGLSDELVVAKWRDDIKAKELARNRAKEEREANEFLAVVLNKCGRYSQKIKNWLSSRINQRPVIVAYLVKEFLKREQNAEMAEYVARTLDVQTPAQVTQPAEVAA